MKVSVIVPIYNVAADIVRCVHSVLHQDWTDLELILVDDCSPDDAMERVATTLETEPRREIVKIIRHAVNQGLSAARNTGTEQASGRYLFFLDGDDYLPSDAISSLAVAAEKDGDDFVIGNYRTEGEKRKTPLLQLESCRLTSNAEVRKAFYTKQWYVMAWGKLINRQFLIDHNIYFYEGIVHEDDLWSFFLATEAQTMTVVDKVCYVYSLRPDSISATNKKRNYDSKLKVIKLEYDYLRSHLSEESAREAYLFFEDAKADYFDYMLYFYQDKVYRRAIFSELHKLQLMPLPREIFSLHIPLSLRFRKFGDCLPESLAYVYFCCYVRITYSLGVKSKDF